jgi:tetratricopeptide (TPR) repeat protein
MTVDEEPAFLLRSITDLDAEHAAGDISDADYRTLRDDYTARAAAALRARDPTAPSAFGASGGRGATSFTESNLGRRRFGVIVGLVMVAVAAGWLVQRSSGERVAGSASTGAIVEGSTDRITRAQQLVAGGKLLEAVKTYDALLRDDPTNPVALAQRGWLISRVDPSLVDKGLDSIDRAIAVDPGYAEAHFFRGMILLQAKGDRDGATKEFQLALEANPPPDLVPTLRELLERSGGNSPP